MAKIHREHLLQLLASDMSLSDVAERLNVKADALVAAIEEDERIITDVARMKAHREIDTLLDKTEHIAVKRLVLAAAQETDPMKLLKIVTGINGARRRSQGETFDMTNVKAAAIVSLQLPERVPVKAQKSSDSQIVGINGRNLETLPSNKLMEMLESKKLSPAEDAVRKKINAKATIEDKRISPEDAIAILEQSGK